METVRDSIEVDAPIEACYEAWRKVENFPRFMANVKEVRSLGGRDTLWVVSVLGVEERWQATLTEDERPRRIAWRATGDVGMDGVVSFSQVAPGQTRISVEFTWHGSGLAEKVAEALKVDEAAVKRSLADFKGYVEGRKTPRQAMG